MLGIKETGEEIQNKTPANSINIYYGKKLHKRLLVADYRQCYSLFLSVGKKRMMEMIILKETFYLMEIKEFDI